MGDGTPKGTRAGRAGRRPSPVTPFFSLHRGCRRPHGGLLCRRTSHGHSAQGLLTAIHLELQGMQVRLSVATAAPGWRAMGGNAGRKGQRVPGPPRGRVSGDRPGCGRSGGRAAPASLLRAPTDPVLASDCPLRRESWQCSSLCSAGHSGRVSFLVTKGGVRSHDWSGSANRRVDPLETPTPRVSRAERSPPGRGPPYTVADVWAGSLFFFP